MFEASQDIAWVPLANGECVALACVEVTSIPYFTSIDPRADRAEAVFDRRLSELMGTLSECHRIYKNRISMLGSADVSLEFLWLSEAVSNQAFKAHIRIFCIVRAIASSAEQANPVVRDLSSAISSFLDTQRYGIEGRRADELLGAIASVDAESVFAIVKEERFENLQSQLLPYCYSFDCVTPSHDDLSRVIDAMAAYPGCALSMQLVPTLLDSDECSAIDNMTQALDTLQRGVAEPGMGPVSFTLAQRPAALYSYYSEHKTAPLFAFTILVYGNRTAASDIASRMVGRLSLGGAGFTTVPLEPNAVQKDANFYPLPWAVGELVEQSCRNNEAWDSGAIPAGLYRMSRVTTLEESAELVRLPLGSERVDAGLTVSRASQQRKTYADNLVNAGDITIGKLKSSSMDDTIGFSLSDLAKHMLVVGTPGSGKTTFSVSLLDRLWKVHGIPFLVIEPAKNEYRALVQSIPDLQVFTPGKSFISPFVFNPFIPPKNVRLETYKSTLKTAFAAGVSMTSPLDKIFEEAINNCYSDFRWLDTYTVDSGGQPFNISDFIRCFQNTFSKIGYTGDAGNIGRAGTVRLKSLENLFDTYWSIPIEDLLSKPTVIELAAIENAEQKSLLISLLLLSILAYVNANYLGEGGLRNVILLEEAHVLLDASMASRGQGESNPSQIAQELVKRMLAEIRSYGVGVVIADQSPRKVGTDVVALTDMKVAFRLVERADKEILGDSINMDAGQIDRLGKLKPGEAFFFFNKLEEPEEVVTPNYRLDNNISVTLSDESIRQLSTYWKGREDKLRPYPECALCSCCEHACDYERRVLARDVARRIFVRNFTPKDHDLEPLKRVLASISALVKAELNREEFTHELLLCVKVHLFRKIRYGTRIPLRIVQIQNSLQK